MPPHSLASISPLLPSSVFSLALSFARYPSLTPSHESGVNTYSACCWGQVAELSGLSARVRQLEQELASARTDLATSEEGLKQATLGLEKADARAEVGALLPCVWSI